MIEINQLRWAQAKPRVACRRRFWGRAAHRRWCRRATPR